MRMKWPLVLGALAVALLGAGVLRASAASPTVYLPTAAELQAEGTTFVLAHPPAGVLSPRVALDDQLAVNGGHWVRFPSQTYVERFGYVSSSTIRALPSSAVVVHPSLGKGPANTQAGLTPAVVQGVPVWAITFGGLALPGFGGFVGPGGQVHPSNTIWRDNTAFVDAFTGQELWETYNHCSPCG